MKKKQKDEPKHEIISKNLQNSVIYLCITDTDFLKMVSGQIVKEFFSSKQAQMCYKICHIYLIKYKRAPKNHFHDEALKYIKHLEESEREIFARYIMNIRKRKEPNKDYVLSRITTWVRERALINSVFSFAKKVEAGKFDEAESLMHEALRTGIQKQDIGLNYLKDFSRIAKRKDRPEFLTPLGIPPIDKIIGGISKTELVLLIGAYKGAKSWFGHHLSRTALLQGLNVLHVTHENSSAEVENRYDMMFGGLTTEDKEKFVEVRWMERNIIKVKKMKRGTIFDKYKVLKARKSIKMFGGNLIIKKYPMGRCTVMELESYLNYLDNFEGFSPDIVINDYADVMKLNPEKSTRDALNDIYIELKGIADERGIAIVTMSQINREGLRAAFISGKVDGSHVAEDIRKIGNIDLGLYVVQPHEMIEDNEAVFGVFANRSGAQKISCTIGWNLAIGQFCAYSFPNNERGEIERD